MAQRELWQYLPGWFAGEYKGIIDEIEDPSFATVVGLCAYGATLEPSSGLPFGISVPQIPNLKVNKIVSKVLDLIKSFIP